MSVNNRVPPDVLETPFPVPDARAYTLAPGRLYLLSMPYRLDGRVSTHADDARGFTAKNCYLVIEDDQAILIDSGLPVHAPALMSWLRDLVEPGMTLSFLPMAFQDAMSVANVPAVAHYYRLGRYLSSVNSAAVSAGLRMDYVGIPGATALDQIPVTLLSGVDAIDVDAGGRRRLEIVRVKLKLFSVMSWFFDEVTGTLFTGDMFGHVGRESGEGPWLLGGTDSTPQAVLHHLLKTRYWWLPGSRTNVLLDDLDAIFESREIIALAPMWGCVVQGQEAVDRERQLLREALQTAGSMSAGYRS